jgi:hypothetical protein
MYTFIITEIIAWISGAVAFVVFLEHFIKRKSVQSFFSRKWVWIPLVVMLISIFSGLFSNRTYSPGFAMPPFMHSMAPGGMPPTLPLANVINFFKNESRFERVADIGRDPNDVPPPITRTSPTEVKITSSDQVDNFGVMQKINPKIGQDVFQDMKMSYSKDINSLSGEELKSLSVKSLKDENTIKDLNYINDKYHLGKIVTNPNEVKVGDIINFWVYDLIEFSPKEGNYSYKETKAEFEKYVQENNIKVKDSDWFVEAPKMVWGHYAVVSAVDNEYIYISSSGEKGGVNGIWNNVPKEQTEEFLTKIRKDDMKLSNLKYEDIKFKKTDDITNMRSRIPLRISILSLE